MVKKRKSQGVKGSSPATEKSVRHALEERDYREVEALVERLLQQGEDTAFLHNSLATVLWHQGHLKRAVEKVEHVLEHIEPNNLQALVHAIHFAVVFGENEKAKQRAERLGAQAAESIQDLSMILKGLSYWGDNKSVVERFDQETSLLLPESEECHQDLSQCFFYVGVAAARLKDEKSAWSHFERAQELFPNLPELAENMDDLSNPLKSQEGSWAFPLHEWVSLRFEERELEALAESALDQGRTPKREKQAKKFWDKYPELHSLIPVLLKRGSPLSRKSVLGIAVGLGTPEALDILESFAFDRFGTDDMRKGVFWILLERGRFEQGQLLSFWEAGSRTHERLFAFELSDEVEGNDPYQKFLPKRAVDGFHQGTLALAENKLEEAEKLLEESYKKAPQYPAVMQNLAALYDRQGDREKSRNMLKTLVEKHPDYLIGRTQMARFAAEGGRFDEAMEWLRPTLHRVKLHNSEFIALVEGMMTFHKSSGNLEEAKVWLDVFRKHLKGNARIRAWEGELSLWVRVRRWAMLPFTLVFFAFYGLLVLVVGAGRALLRGIKKL